MLRLACDFVNERSWRTIFGLRLANEVHSNFGHWGILRQRTFA
jgi:hypothetical protein